MSDRHLRTFVKIDGTYPPGNTATFHRYKDRLVVNVGAVDAVPAHSISIEMTPVLKEFREMVDALDCADLPEGRHRCRARLALPRDGIVRCHLPKGHNGLHAEFGNADPVDNWPPRAQVRWPKRVGAFRPWNARTRPEWIWDEDEAAVIPPPFTGKTSRRVERIAHRLPSGKQVTLRIRLPKWRTFVTRKPNQNPISVFGAWVARQLGGLKEGQQLKPGAMYLCPEDDLGLMEVERYWFARKGSADDAVWTSFMWSPARLDTASDRAVAWANPGWVYCRQDLIVEDHDNPSLFAGRAKVIELGQDNSS